MHIWKTIEAHVFSVASRPDLFNPYNNVNAELDRFDAVAIRRENLHGYIADHEQRIELLLVAEAPGPWGCRFSGVPITSESQLEDPEFPAVGRQSSLRDEPYSEYSATIYWKLLQPFYRSTFVWNTVPLHPHRNNEPLSIRAPRQEEINEFLPLLSEIVAFVQPKKVLAVGRKAENALQRIGAVCTYVRHPSQGGARLFEHGVRSALGELGLKPQP